MRRLTWLSAFLCLLMLPTSYGNSLDSTPPKNWERVKFNGFGGVRYGSTDENLYLESDSNGSFRTKDFSLVLHYEPSKRFSVGLAAFGGKGRGGSELNLDFAFLRWHLSDSLSFQAGRARLPVGFYSEILKVGTLRPFLVLPQGMYGPSGVVADFYDGAGLHGMTPLGRDWEIEYDIYGGVMEIEHNEAFGEANFDLDVGMKKVRDLLGSRVVFSSLDLGLSFDLKALTGKIGHHGGSGRHEVVGLGLEYLNDCWSVRAEAIRHEEAGATFETAYFEGAWQVDQHWQLALRWDSADLKSGRAAVSLPESLFHHLDLSFGLNYWISPRLVIKASVHDVQGNLFAGPEDFDPETQALDLKEDTSILLFGAHFSF